MPGIFSGGLVINEPYRGSVVVIDGKKLLKIEYKNSGKVEYYEERKSGGLKKVRIKEGQW